MSERIINILFPLLIIVIVLSGSIFWSYPTIQNYLTNKTNIEVTEKLIAQSLEPKRNVLAQTNMQEVDDMIAIIKETLPENANPSYLLAITEYIATSVGVQLSRLIYSSADGTESLETVVLSASITGNAQQVSDFIRLITEAAPPYKIAQFSSQSGSFTGLEDLDDGVFTIHFIVQSPFVKQLQGIQLDIQQPTTPLVETERTLVEVLKSNTQYDDILSEFKDSNNTIGKNNLFE